MPATFFAAAQDPRSGSRLPPLDRDVLDDDGQRLYDAVAGLVHIGKRPARAGMALLGGVAIGLDGLFLLALLVGIEAELEEVEGAGFLADASVHVESARRWA